MAGGAEFEPAADAVVKASAASSQQNPMRKSDRPAKPNPRNTRPPGASPRNTRPPPGANPRSTRPPPEANARNTRPPPEPNPRSTRPPPEGSEVLYGLRSSLAVFERRREEIRRIGFDP